MQQKVRKAPRAVEEKAKQKSGKKKLRVAVSAAAEAKDEKPVDAPPAAESASQNPMAVDNCAEKPSQEEPSQPEAGKPQEESAGAAICLPAAGLVSRQRAL